MDKVENVLHPGSVSSSFKMLKLLMVVFLCSCMYKNGACEFNAELVHSFFDTLNIGSVNAFGCYEEDLVKMMSQMSKQQNLKYYLMGIRTQLPNIYPAFQSLQHPIGVFLDISCNRTKEIFWKLSNEYLLNMSYVFLIKSDDYNKAIEFLDNSTLQFDSRVILASNGHLFDLYRIEPKWDIISTKIGSYKDSFQAHLTHFPERIDLNGTAMKSSLVLSNFPYDSTPESLERLLDYNYEPELELLSRLGIFIHTILEPVFNFRHDFKPVTEWGQYNDTSGHWNNGMFGELEQNNVHIGLSISRIFTQRLDAAFYFPPCLTFRSCFIFKHPSTLTAVSALLKPFSVFTWLAVIACILMSSILLRYIKQMSGEPASDTAFMASVIVVLGTICQQGLVKDSIRISTRVLSFFLLLISLLIYTFYGAAVVGFLLMPSPRTINTMDKLIQSPLVAYSENLQYFKTHFKAPFTENIAKTAVAIKGPTPEQDRYIDIKHGLEKVQKGGTALYSQDTNLYAVIDKTFKSSEICALAEVEVMVVHIATVIRKKSPYRELMTRGLLLIRNNGILERAMKKWKSRRPECFSKEESSVVTLEAILVAYLIYLTGFFLCILIFLVEIKSSSLNKEIRTAPYME